MLADDELQSLADDIKTNGLRSPITVIDGNGEWLILDGRNRYLACEMAGVKADRVVWAGKDPVAFVVSTNLHRRHLNSSQRAMIAESIAQLRHGERGPAKSRKESPIGDSSATQAEAATLLNVSKRNVERARQVKEKGVPALAAAVAAGEVAVSAAAEVAKLPKEEQAAVVAQGKKAIAARSKQEREKALPSSVTLTKWDREDFLGEIRSQIQDWREEWRRREPSLFPLITTFKLAMGIMEQEHDRAS